MLVLASASPRRQELLRNAGIDFIVQASNFPEHLLPNEAPKVYAERLAREKALVVFQEHPDKFVLGADTIVMVRNGVLGKPADAEDATRMLQSLSGKSHHVVTGVCLLGPGFVDVRSDITTVEMQKIRKEEIEAYVATGEPMDKAGAYAIQGWASRWISKIEGDYFNVVGLPISLVYRMLLDHGALSAEKKM